MIPSRARWVRFVLYFLVALMVTGFLGLGTWQVKRLYWKRDLKQRVELRVHAPPGAAPDRPEWLAFDGAANEYRHVVVTGIFLENCSVHVKAVSVFGAGSWILTPLRRRDGGIVLINRGFVAIDPSVVSSSARCLSSSDSTGSAPRTVTGLLRISEPGGGFLRQNDPANQRWYSRDVAGIAVAQGLQRVAPYFIDADATESQDGPAAAALRSGTPIGGLTVISFPDNHLVYAITWYVLALMAAAAGWRILHSGSRDSTS